MIRNRMSWQGAKISSALFAVILLAVSAGAARGDDSRITSDAIRAANIAYIDFENRLSSRDDREGALAAYVLNPKNYDIGISQTKETYIVVLRPRRVPPYEYLMGGGGQYFIRKSDLMIVRFVGNK